MKIDMKNKQLFVFFALLALILPTSSFAQTSLPTILVAYKDVVSAIITKVLVGIVIVVMMGYAAWESRTGQQGLQPLKWASFASIILASAVYFGPSLITYAKTAFSSTGMLSTSTTLVTPLVTP